MRTWSVAIRKVALGLGVGVVVAAAAGAARAQGVDFSTFLSGGGGGIDPRTQKIAQGSGAFVCLRVTQTTPPNHVLFTISSSIPQPKATVTVVAFDLGKYKTLFQNVSVAFASPGVKGTVVPAKPHSFLPRMKPDYWIDIDHSDGHNGKLGLRPGKFMGISAELAPGKTIADVGEALRVGLNPATGADGLRVGVIVIWLLGGPPPGRGTIMDDGGFLMTKPSELCR